MNKELRLILDYIKPSCIFLIKNGSGYCTKLERRVRCLADLRKCEDNDVQLILGKGEQLMDPRDAMGVLLKRGLTGKEIRIKAKEKRDSDRAEATGRKLKEGDKEEKKAKKEIKDYEKDRGKDN